MAFRGSRTAPSWREQRREEGRKYLILMDMNGTICYRSVDPVRGVGRADLHLRHKYFYKRPGIEDMIKELSATKKFEICVYTSMMKHNVDAGLNVLLSRARHHISRVFDMDFNKPDPEGENEWDTVRDMDQIWKALPGHGPKRTILLDNQARKFKDTPRNGIVVPEFGPQEVEARTADTLVTLTEYLVQLAEAGPDDVRDYLEKHSFEEYSARQPEEWEDSYSDHDSEDDALDVLLQQVRGLSMR